MTECASELINTYTFYNIKAFDNYIMKISMHSRIDAKTMKQVSLFWKKIPPRQPIFLSIFVHAGQRHMRFPSLSSTHTKILINCISHFFQEHEDSRCCICQKLSEEGNLLRTFCVQTWTALGNVANFRKNLKTDKYLDSTKKSHVG